VHYLAADRVRTGGTVTPLICAVAPMGGTFGQSPCVCAAAMLMSDSGLRAAESYGEGWLWDDSAFVLRHLRVHRRRRACSVWQPGFVTEWLRRRAAFFAQRPGAACAGSSGIDEQSTVAGSSERSRGIAHRDSDERTSGIHDSRQRTAVAATLRMGRR